MVEVMKKHKQIIILFFSYFILVATLQTTSAYVAVADNFKDNNILTVGFNNADFSTIQEAIHYAKSNTTIYITSGIYTEIITINKPLTLIGENKQTTIIHPTSNQNSFAVHSTAPNVIIKELSISNDGPGLYTTGLKITGSKTLVEDCIFYDTPIGVAIWSSYNTIVNNTFYGCNDEGIAVLGTVANPSMNNHIKRCIFYNNTHGIELQNALHTIIEKCEFFDNNHGGIDIIGSYSTNNTILNCSFHNNKVFGLYMIRSTHTTIINCNFINSSLMCRLSSNITIQSTSFETLQLYDTKIQIHECEDIDEKNIHAVQSVFTFSQQPQFTSPIFNFSELNKTNTFPMISTLIRNIFEKINTIA